MSRFLAPIIILAILVGVFFVGLHNDPSIVPSPLIGKPAPVYELPLLLRPGETLGTEKLLGQVYLLNIWGTWCPACLTEHDALLEIQRQNIVPIYGFNWKDDPHLARQWLAQLGNPYVASMVDTEGRVGIDWGVYGAPETFLVDQNGTIIHKLIAAMTMEIWHEDFLPLIQQLNAAQP
ncbi:MAG: DsbE family thiol:disulfide interchange protein [Gammaproteobacteria bacterium]|nr:DsbE family thiol:disulfide interchange protein [Gammaproteobacteria bacterium]